MLEEDDGVGEEDGVTDSVDVVLGKIEREMVLVLEDDKEEESEGVTVILDVRLEDDDTGEREGLALTVAKGVTEDVQGGKGTAGTADTHSPEGGGVMLSVPYLMATMPVAGESQMKAEL